MLSTVVKYLYLILGSIYAYIHILNVKNKRKHVLYHLLFTVLVLPIILLIRYYVPALTIISIIIILTMYFSLSSHKPHMVCFRASLISVSINYVCLSLSVPLVFLIIYPVYLINGKDLSIFDNDIILTASFTFFHWLLIVLIFSLKRFKNGIPNIDNSKFATFYIYICILLIIISSIVFFQPLENSTIIATLVIITIAFGILLYLWWRHNITTTYMLKVKEREIDIAEHTIEKQKLEIEKLSKIIHKDNKLLSAMELSVKSLCENPTPAHKEHLLTELDFLSKERSDTLNHYEGTSVSLPKTNVFSIDMIIDYLHKKALDENIRLDVALMGNISFLVSDIVDEHDLGTLLSDLGENAIHATSGMENRRILLSMGVKDTVYFLSIYDSGSSFSQKVIEHLGQKRYTTRKSEGGSGIGLMTTIEILKKYMASFELEEFNEDASYTKCISLIWDNKNEIRMKGPNAKQYEANSIRKDILFL